MFHHAAAASAASTSTVARLSSSSLGTLWCNLVTFSMTLTPLPTAVPTATTSLCLSAPVFCSTRGRAHGVADVVRVVAVQGFQVIFWSETRSARATKSTSAQMTFALDVVDAVGAPKRFGANRQDAVVEHVEGVKTGETAADMAGSARLRVKC